ncbi:hypothetical protein Vafri_18561 [Volvox africanus]|uniref:Uncharacterized protein n=1 Tax=Volvox africanus TaxID=51714 RepID=A0A8J4BPI5_9CHLO|nr:hypothetical protein Vafri_18561 [Volvox africanus]
MMGSGKVFSSKESPATKEMGDPAAGQIPCALSSQAGASSRAVAAAAEVAKPPPTTAPSPVNPTLNPHPPSPAARFSTARRSMQTWLPPPCEAAAAPSNATSRPLAI